MQTILVRDENDRRLKDLAKEQGQTLEEMLEAVIIQPKATLQMRLEQAAIALQNDYANDPKLTAFTALDEKPFYEYDDKNMTAIKKALATILEM